MRLGVYVGSFNPVHIGHIKLIKELIEKKYLDRIYVIATKPYWDKNNLVSLQDRINMLKYFETEDIIINTYYNEYDYTYEILNDLKKKYKDDELYLIIGADNLEKFHLWKNINEILKNKILVLKRNNIDSSKYINNFKEKDNFVIANDVDELNISSTEIRKNLDYGKKYLDKRVLKYIKANNLYWRQ